MAKVEKQKVSFDIPVSEYNQVKEIVDSTEGMKLADFYRDAVQDKIKKENRYMTIYVLDLGTIRKLTILTANYDIVTRKASDEMIENVGAGREGTLSRKGDRFDIEPSIDPIIFFDDPIIEALLDKNDEVHFFTKNKY